MWIWNVDNNHERVRPYKNQSEREKKHRTKTNAFITTNQQQIWYSKRFGDTTEWIMNIFSYLSQCTQENHANWENSEKNIQLQRQIPCGTNILCRARGRNGEGVRQNERPKECDKWICFVGVAKWHVDKRAEERKNKRRVCYTYTRSPYLDCNRKFCAKFCGIEIKWQAKYVWCTTTERILHRLEQSQTN